LYDDDDDDVDNNSSSVHSRAVSSSSVDLYSVTGCDLTARYPVIDRFKLGESYIKNRICSQW